jgi:two-component system, NarL family, response regulator DesR
MNDTIRVVVAEDNDDLRAVMEPLINAEPDMRCVASTALGEEVGALVAEHQANVAILDIQLRDGSMLARLPALCEKHPSVGFIIHSGHSNPELQRRAMEAGAAAFLLKSGDIDELIAAIRRLDTR